MTRRAAARGDMDDGQVLEVRLGGDGPPSAAGAAARAVAQQVGLGSAEATRVRAVVEELVVESLAREEADGEVDVVLAGTFDGTVLRFTVTDQRLPVAPKEARSLRSRKLVGLGFVDRLHIANQGRAGNVAECEVRVDRSGDDARAAATVEAQLPDDVAAADDATAAGLEVRPMEAGDAFGLVRCLYRCYGYTYKEPAMYDRRAIEHMLRTRSMRSVVAVLADGSVVGHSAFLFERPGDRVPEAGRLVVDPRFRGHHLAERLARARGQLAREAGIPGVWAECVANHPASQRMVLAAGGAEVGLLIGASPGGVTMAGLGNDNVGRRTLVATFTRASGSNPSTIHVRSRHADLFETLAERLRLPRQVVALDEGDAPEGATRLRSTVDPGAGTAHLRVLHLGADLLAATSDQLEALLPDELGATYLDLPLWNRHGAWAVEQLERLGFCWAAWIPDFDPDGDVVRLQRVGDHPVDVEHVVCARPEGEQLRDHVIDEWHRVRRLALGA